MYSSKEISSLPSEYEFELVSSTGDNSAERASMVERATRSLKAAFQTRPSGPSGAEKMAGVARGVSSGSLHGTRSTVHGKSSASGPPFTATGRRKRRNWLQRIDNRRASPAPGCLPLPRLYSVQRSTY